MAASCGFHIGTSLVLELEAKAKLPHLHTCAHFVCASHVMVFGVAVLTRDGDDDGDKTGSHEGEYCMSVVGFG
jgi:hypothetical protein